MIDDETNLKNAVLKVMFYFNNIRYLSEDCVLWFHNSKRFQFSYIDYLNHLSL